MPGIHDPALAEVPSRKEECTYEQWKAEFAHHRHRDMARIASIHAATRYYQYGCEKGDSLDLLNRYDMENYLLCEVRQVFERLGILTVMMPDCFMVFDVRACESLAISHDVVNKVGSGNFGPAWES